MVFVCVRSGPKEDELQVASIAKLPPLSRMMLLVMRFDGGMYPESLFPTSIAAVFGHTSLPFKGAQSIKSRLAAEPAYSTMT